MQNKSLIDCSTTPSYCPFYFHWLTLAWWVCNIRLIFMFILFVFFNISMVSWQYLNSAVYWEVKRWTTLVGGSEVFPRTGPRYNSCKSSSSQPHHPGPALALLILLKLLKRFSKFNASKSSVHCLLHPPLKLLTAQKFWIGSDLERMQSIDRRSDRHSWKIWKVHKVSRNYVIYAKLQFSTSWLIEQGHPLKN